MLDSEFWILDAGFKEKQRVMIGMKDIGFWILNAGCWIQGKTASDDRDVGCWTSFILHIKTSCP
jgi:hypothetical protein